MCGKRVFHIPHCTTSQAIAPSTQIPMSLCCGTLTLWGLSGYRCVYCSATACAEGIRSTALQFESPTHRQKGRLKGLPFLFCVCRSLRGAVDYIDIVVQWKIERSSFFLFCVDRTLRGVSTTSNKRSMSGCAKKNPHVAAYVQRGDICWVATVLCAAR